MKQQIATSHEQSERLLKCGVDPKTADMVWTTFDNDGEKSTKLDVMDEYAYEFASLHPIPAWSLSALLEILPRSIIESGVGVECKRRITTWCDTPYFLGYERQVFDKWANAYVYLAEDESLIECCVQMIETLAKEGYKFNEP